MTVIPDRGLYTLLIQHAIKRTADFIRAHELEYINPDHQSALIAYVTKPFSVDPVRGYAPPRVVGETASRDVARRTTRIRESLARVQDKSADVCEGDSSRPAKERKEKVIKDKHS
jgi:hypothetical protein